MPLVDWAGLVAAWGPFLGWVAASAAAGWLFDRFVVATVRAAARRTKTEIDDLIVRAVHPALVFAVFFAGVGLALRAYAAALPPRFVAWVGGLTLAVIAFLVALSLARLLAGVLHYRARKEPRWTPAATLGSRVFSGLIWAVALLTVLRQYGVTITPLVTSLGVAGLAIALALQDTLANFFAGLWVQTGKTLWPGHFIKVEEKNVEGFVEEVGWRTTKIRTLPGNMVIIPNQALAQSTITDYWLPEPKMGTSITVTTGFEADPERVVPMLLEEIRAAVRENDFMLEEPAPFARLNRRVDNGWEFWMSFWVKAYFHQWNAQGAVWNRIRKRFLREGIRMPYPLHEQYNVPDGRIDVARSIAAPAADGAALAVRKDAAPPSPPGT